MVLLRLDIYKLLRLVENTNFPATVVSRPDIRSVLRLFGNALILAMRFPNCVRYYILFESRIVPARSVLIVRITLGTTEAIYYTTQVFMTAASQRCVEVKVK